MTTTDNFLRLGLLALCLVLSAFFSSSETALFGLSSLRVRKYKATSDRNLRAIARLLEAPRELIVTLLIGNELVNVSTSILVAALALSVWGPSGKWAAMVISTLLLLVFGEVAPKTYAIHRPESHSRLVVRPLSAFQWLITPVRFLLVRLVDFLTPRAAGKVKARRARLTEEEFKTLVELGHTEGVLEAEEKELINSVVAFGDTRVGEIMTPRTDMTCLPKEITFDDVMALVRKSFYSRVPIYRESLDHIVGILYVKDLLKVVRGDQSSWRLRDVLRPVHFILQTKLVSEMLQEFQAKKFHMAIVVDEHGGVAGLVTMEDILEELFGEITDEFDKTVKLVHIEGLDEWRVAGKLPLEELGTLVEVELPVEEFDTVGGFVFHCFGHLPEPKEVVQYENLTFKVEKVLGPRILEVRVKKES
jgi:CBS domain containing-hemolysin-like protein